jgi:hypothetical protein
MTALHVVIIILLVFTALGVACAVGIGRRRGSPVGPPSHPGCRSAQFCRDLERAYSRDQLEAIARRPVQSDSDSGGASRPDADARRCAIPPMPWVPAGTRAAGVRHV